MQADDLNRIKHMLDAAKEACSFAKDKSREDLADNRMLVLAVLKDLEIRVANLEDQVYRKGLSPEEVASATGGKVVEEDVLPF